MEREGIEKADRNRRAVEQSGGILYCFNLQRFLEIFLDYFGLTFLSIE